MVRTRKENRSKIATDPVLFARTRRPNGDSTFICLWRRPPCNNNFSGTHHFCTDDSAKAEQHRKIVIPNSDATQSEVQTSTVNMPLMQTHVLLLDACCSVECVGGKKNNNNPLASSFFVPQSTAQLESDALQEFITCSIY